MGSLGSLEISRSPLFFAEKCVFTAEKRRMISEGGKLGFLRFSPDITSSFPLATCRWLDIVLPLTD